MARKTSCPRRRASSNPGAHPLDSRLRGNDPTPQGPHGLAVYLRNGHLGIYGKQHLTDIAPCLEIMVCRGSGGKGERLRNDRANLPLLIEL